MCKNTSYAGTRDAANRTIRFDIRQGKLAQWMGQGQQAREYDYVQGYLTGISLRKLKNDRFAAFVVGDIRDPDGFYRDFISDTIRAFEKHGAKLYNQLILLEQLGTVPLRARRQFMGLRKVVKVHQNVLVFYKGDTKKIKDNYKEVLVADFLEDDETALA